jgi:hypothetical protein
MGSKEIGSSGHIEYNLKKNPKGLNKVFDQRFEANENLEITLKMLT